MQNNLRLEEEVRQEGVITREMENRINEALFEATNEEDNRRRRLILE